MNFFTSVDHHLFFLINQKWINPFFDMVMPFITEFKNTWWIVLILALVWIGFQKKTAIKALLGCLLLLAFTDSFNSKIVKNIAERPRPETALGHENVRLLTHHHSGYSFPSSHAINCFGVATFIMSYSVPAGIIALPIAFAVAYSRVYVGVHFPADVIAGGLLGILCAAIVRRLIDAASVIVGRKKVRRR